MITREYLKELIHYNPDTGVFTWIVPRGTRKAGATAGCIHTSIDGKSYVRIGLDKKVYEAHRLAWLFAYGEFPTDETDHANGDGTDNRLCNLRSVTSSENAKNKRLQSNNTSGTCGVVWHKASRKWAAQITIDSKTKYLGSFKDINDAISARIDAEVRYGFHSNHGTNRPL